MAAHEVIRRQIKKVMPQGALLYRFAKLRDAGVVRAALVDHIAGVDLGALRAQIAIEPVAVVSGVDAPLRNEPQVPVCPAGMPQQGRGEP